ncbi:unnamed protein product [Ilex paraguariensis]|uniref:Bifunctional inhibitor/plant lipid transfer protein/seed storage helical domain-containing protein n=1 Tax=Ilex paraguariensis TaxID=185542 RepID=A0ABC8SB38_9AQUA
MGRKGGQKVVIFCIFAALLVVAVMATMEDDEKDCADQLANLAACIPFVSGGAKKPTPECCEDTQKVKSVKPKCLCVLIKESTDPSMGLPINTTLALQMPAACNIDAKISDCPTILKLPPDSPDAKIFKVADGGGSGATNSTTGSSSTPANSETTSSKSPSSSSETGSSSDSKRSTSSTCRALLDPSLLVKMGLASIAVLMLI